MKVVFSHGKESGPWGSKITRLATLAKAQGCTVESIDYGGMDDPDQRVEWLVSLLTKETGQVLLVGSSMGAYVALVAAEKLASAKLANEKLAAEKLASKALADELAISARVTVAGVFLLAPALYLPGYRVQAYHPQCSHIAVVHAWSDELIPAANAIRFAQQHNCSLHLIPGDHRLNSSMHLVEPLFNQFIGCALANPIKER